MQHTLVNYATVLERVKTNNKVLYSQICYFVQIQIKSAKTNHQIHPQ